MKLKINISTCPNDTFMFDALLANKIDTLGFEFEPHLADIEILNKMVQSGTPDISKISYAVYPLIEKEYKLLMSGSAMGYGNGPLLVSKRVIDKSEIKDMVVAIAGKNTTANLLLKRTIGEVKELRSYLFSDIAQAILNDEVDAGVLIHEGRFTYKDIGLRLVADLGQEWFDMYKLPIPLGAIAIKRSLGEKVEEQINKLIADSITFAFENRESSYSFVKHHAKELSDNVINKHINMFVNNFSLNIGNEGEKAIKELLRDGKKQ